MVGDDIARLVYLVLLLSVIGGYFLMSNKKQLGKTAQQAAIWALIFLGAIAVAGLWGDVRRAAQPQAALITGDGIEVPVADDGHFYLNAEVNGSNVLFVVDTGASDIVLSERDARRVGFDPDTLNYFGTAMTANGQVATAPVRLETLKLGERIDEQVPAVVNSGELDTSLLGMSYLSRYELVLTRGRLILKR
ncbi:MAG: TIGR02281 family clan AA aspartic protease [Paracoccaceae bacterium]|jgi:aspartyl protease family protein|nr:TIGR02281 family clan AA aspartic protease [Paracoccaceae bacterium]